MTINEITIFPAVAKANVGSTINFTYQISPAEYNKDITFSSSNNEIMTVRNLCMRFLSEGNVSLIISNNDGFEKRYNITVGKALNGLDKTQAEIEEALLQLEEQIIKNVNSQSQLIKEQIQEQQTDLFSKTSEFKRLLLADYDRLRTEYESSILEEMNENVNTFESKILTLIDKYNSTIKNDSEAAYELLNKIRKSSSTLINELENNLTEKYDNFKNELTNLISERKDFFIKDIEESSITLKSNLNAYLKQLDNTLNYSLDKIEAGMHVAIDNIESAEATAISNIAVLKEEILKNITASLDNIDEIITEHVKEAESRIDKITDSAISNLRKTEIELKNNLEKASEASLEKLDSKLVELSEQLQNQEQLLEVELVKKKTELMDEIQVNKDEFIMEMTKVKSKLLAQFTDEVTIFFNALGKREQEIIANIIATVNGYDLDIETIIDAKVEMFRASIEVIYASFINNFKLMLDETLFNFGEVKDQYLETLLNALNSHLNDLQTAYNKHETDLNSLLESHIGTLNQLQKDILDFIGRTAEDGLWSNIRTNLLEYTENQINRINQVKDSTIARIGTTDDAMYDEDTPSVRKDAIDAIIKKKDENVGIIVGEASDLIKEFISTLTEQRYTCILPAHTSLIQLPDDFSLGDRVRLYVNGVLLILDKHYTIDKVNRTITLSEVYSTSAYVHVTEDLPDVNIQTIKDQLYVDGEEYKKNTLRLFEDETTRHTTNFDNHIEDKKVEFDEYADNTVEVVVNKYIEETTKPMIDTYVETDSYIKINAHTELKEKQLDDYIEETSKKTIDEYVKNTSKPDIDNHSEIKKEEISEYTNTTGINIIRDYIASLAEQQFYCEQPSGISIIQLPYDFATSSKTRVFINGQLIMLGKHYTIDKETNIINLVTPYATKVEIFVITDFATNEYSELTSKVKNLEELVEMLKKQIDSLKNGGTSN